MSYVSIDIETLGLNPETCDVIEFGAVIDNGGRKVDELPTYHCYLTREVYRGEPYAMAMHTEKLRRIADRTPSFTYMAPELLGDDFSYWLVEHGYQRGSYNDPVRIVVAGKNFASFDWRFLRRLENFENNVSICHRLFDPAMLYFQPGKDEKPPSMEECLERAKMPKAVAHNAVDDARDVIRLLRHQWYH